MLFTIFSTVTHQSSDEELMRAAAHGNRNAFEWLYERYYNRIVLFCRQLLRNNPTLAEDIAQEVFLIIIHQPYSFDTKQKFSTWIYTIAKNKCFNQLRNEQQRQQLLDLHYKSNTTTHIQPIVDAQHLKQRLTSVFKTLSDKEKTLFVLRFEQELSIKEISELTQIPEGSVKSGLHYLLKKLGTHLTAFTHEK